MGLIFEEVPLQHIEHRAGKRILHVDALSHNPLLVCLLVDEDRNGLVFQRETQQKDVELYRFLAALKDQLLMGFLEELFVI